jgi:hypothetical protein
MDKNTSQADIREEERRLKTLRFMSDITFQRLHLERMTLKDAYGAVEELRRVAVSLFPGKAHVFDLVLRPRMERVIAERFFPHN